MPFPNHPRKYGSDPVVTPERSADYAESVADAALDLLAARAR